MKTMVAGLMAMLALSSVATAQTIYSIAEIGATGCAPSGVNDVGDVAGQCAGVATVWENGVPITLGKLANGTYSVAESSNVARVAVGNGDAGDGRPRAELFRNGTVIDIDPSAANAYAIFINDNGVIAGNALKGFGTCNSWVAAIWVEDSSKPGSFRERTCSHTQAETAKSDANSPPRRIARCRLSAGCRTRCSGRWALSGPTTPSTRCPCSSRFPEIGAA